MRYILLLSVVVIIGILIYFEFTGASSLFSSKGAVKYEDVQPAVDRMQEKIDTYNEKLNNSIQQTEDAFK
jgi:hypothetical protein